MTRTDYDAIPEIALEWVHQGYQVALAHVVQTWGSAPRPVGSMLAVRGDGAMMGSVSGGCVEGAVIAEAQEVLGRNTARLMQFGIADADAFAVGLACGGEIEILIEPADAVLLARLVAARAAREPIVYAINLQTWARQLIASHTIGALGDAARRALLDDRATQQDDWFLNVFNAPLRLAIVGAVHIAQPLVIMAQLCGFETSLIDPRDAYAAKLRFPDHIILSDWPDHALRALDLDRRTAVVTLAHDPKLDDPAIITALNSDCFYLGCLGSTRTHAKRVARLTAAGISAAELARIHAPVGAAIAAKSPAEIAVSIMAQIIETRRRPKPQ